MKMRNDFVSNSSSCSFVIVVDKGFEIDDLVSEICTACLAHADGDDAEYASRCSKMNHIVLDYHLNMSELLFLGTLNIGKKQCNVDKKNEFDLELNEDERIVEENDSSLTIEYNNIAGNITVSSYYMDYVTGAYHWNNDYSCKEEEQKKAAELIVDFAKTTSEMDYKASRNSNTYAITRNSIWNTRALIAAGYEVELEQWMDLDTLEERIKSGDKIFVVHVNNGGDGESDDAVYSYGGWDGEDVFNNISNVEVIYSEVM